MVREARESGALVVIPWGAGKWLGRRGAVLSRYLRSVDDPGIFLGDNGGRPNAWRPRHFGLGETREELRETFAALRGADVDVLTVGQYLQPTNKHLPIEKWVTPEEFVEMREEALEMGFLHVESGPFVRSSYHAKSHVSDGS